MQFGVPVPSHSRCSSALLAKEEAGTREAVSIPNKKKKNSDENVP